MFDKLKKKLKSFSKTVEEKVIDKGKAAISGETVLGEKELRSPLEELEVALLENDAALSVVEELISHRYGKVVLFHHPIQ